MRASFSCLGIVLGLAAGCRSEAHPERASPTLRSAPERPLAAGDAAPDFKALSHIGYSVGLRDFGDRPVLVQICPDGFDAACVDIARALRTHWLSLNQRLAMALFVAPLGYVESRALASAEQLPFLVLADTDRAIAQAFGVRDASRVGFLIGPKLTVARVLGSASGEDYVRDLTSALP
jgi:thioredoxin-dependent peroxiredoxin